MPETYKGSCLCGQITFEASGFSKQAAACHCMMCRKFHGAPIAVLVETDYFRYLAGEDQLKHYTASNDTVRTFCRCCGSSIGFTAAQGDFEVAVACFDEDIPVTIDANVYTDYGACWFEPIGNVPAYAEGRSVEK